MVAALIAFLVALATPQIGFSRTADIAYAEGARGRLDVYSPRPARPNAPVVVFFYGGGWEGGFKELYRFVGAALARQGVVTVIPDYRVHPEVTLPDLLADNAKAVAWTRANAGRFGGDPGKLFLMGHSAGAYNAAMLGLDRRRLALVGLDPRRDVRGVIGLSGAYDFLPLKSPNLMIFFGPPEDRPDTQPVNHVDGREPPFLLLAGAKDPTVSPRNTSSLADRIRSAGGQVEAGIYPKAGHGETITAYLPVFRSRLDVSRRVLDFINAHAGG